MFRIECLFCNRESKNSVCDERCAYGYHSLNKIFYKRLPRLSIALLKRCKKIRLVEIILAYEEIANHLIDKRNKGVFIERNDYKELLK